MVQIDESLKFTEYVEKIKAQCIEFMKEHHIDADKYELSEQKIFFRSVANNYGHIFFTSKENCSRIAFDIGGIDEKGRMSDFEVTIGTDWNKLKKLNEEALKGDKP